MIFKIVGQAPDSYSFKFQADNVWFEGNNIIPRIKDQWGREIHPPADKVGLRAFTLAPGQFLVAQSGEFGEFDLNENKMKLSKEDREALLKEHRAMNHGFGAPSLTGMPPLATVHETISEEIKQRLRDAYRANGLTPPPAIWGDSGGAGRSAVAASAGKPEAPTEIPANDVAMEKRAAQLLERLWDVVAPSSRALHWPDRQLHGIVLSGLKREHEIQDENPRLTQLEAEMEILLRQARETLEDPDFSNRRVECGILAAKIDKLIGRDGI